MDQCPACKARWSGKPTCHRCGADLARLAAIEADAADQLERALAAWRASQYDAMYQHARRSCELLRTPTATSALAVSALLTGRFDVALAQWRRLAGHRDEEETAH